MLDIEREAILLTKPDDQHLTVCEYCYTYKAELAEKNRPMPVLQALKELS